MKKALAVTALLCLWPQTPMTAAGDDSGAAVPQLNSDDQHRAALVLGACSDRITLTTRMLILANVIAIAVVVTLMYVARRR